jgi:hypothetical protein
MKKFLTKILLFILPLMIIAFPLDYLISSNLKKSVVHVDGEYLIWNEIYTEKIDVDIAIYGSSRAWIHISPEILQDSLGLSAYNFGIDALNFEYQYFRHKEYLKHNPKPKYIIISGDLFSFESEQGFYNYEQVLPYMLFNDDYYNFRESFKVFSWVDFYVPLTRYFGQTWEMARAAYVAAGLENDPPARVHGYMGIERPWNNDLELAEKKHGNIEVVIDKKLLDLFDRFIIECKNDNIQVVLVYSPEYIKGRRFVKNREDIMNLWHSIAEKHNLIFLDYSQDSIGNDIKYFYNSTHLNKQGSQLFSRRLAGDLKPLIGN